jgi:hypothetical protein
MNTIGIDKIEIQYAKSLVSIKDIFVDGHSLQKSIKIQSPEYFSMGRLNESFSPVLGRGDLEGLDVYDHIFSHLIPKENEACVMPLYGCHDGCCLYVFVRVLRKDDVITWGGIGLNASFLPENNLLEDNIKWLIEFEDYNFDITNYREAINLLK